MTSQGINILHIHHTMARGGGAQKGILNIIRRADPARFCSALAVIDRTTEPHELDLSDVDVLPIQSDNPEGSLWQQRGFIKALRRHIRTRGIDIVHAHDIIGQRMAILATLGTRTKVIRTIRLLSSLSAKRFGLMFRLLTFLTDKYTVVGPDLFDNLRIVYSAKGDKVVLIPNGIDPAQIEPTPGARERVRTELGLAQSDVVVLCAGRLESQKDFPTAVEGVHLARKRAPTLKAFIAGEGSQQAAVRETIARLGQDDAIVMLGLRDDMPDLLAAADIVLFTSRYEGLCRFLLEAMAARSAIVATDVPGIRCAVRHEDEALLTRPQSPPETAAALARLAHAPDLRARLAANARARALNDFSLQSTIRGYEDLYERLVRAR